VASTKGTPSRPTPRRQSPQHEDQKAPPREEHGHEQSTEHVVAQTLDEAETGTHILAETPDQTSQSYNRDKYHR
jgi:hypothetical protein